jgi:hypothetical protein
MALSWGFSLAQWVARWLEVLEDCGLNLGAEVKFFLQLRQ